MGITKAAAPRSDNRIYKTWLLCAFLLVYTFNFVDRILISILQEPLKAEFHLSDQRLGILGGPSFALLYSLSALPIAWIAERSNRVSIVAVGLALWSAMTALSGFATSYWHLLGARIGVGVGEATCAPSVHSIVSDSFSPERRASALAVVMLGVPVGTILAATVGGALAQDVGWRSTFIILGVPGAAFAVLLRLTIREPTRTAGLTSNSFAKTIVLLFRKKSFLHMTLAGGFLNFFGYGTSLFMVSHLVRSLGLGLRDASLLFGLVTGVGGMVGLFAGGYACDRLYSRYPGIQALLPALASAASAPLFVLAFQQGTPTMFFGPAILAVALHHACIGPMFSAVQAAAGPKSRSTAAAIGLLVSNLIGYCLGPVFVGAASDVLANQFARGRGLPSAHCSTSTQELCLQAQAAGLQQAMVIAAAALLVAAMHFILARPHLKKDYAG